MYARRGSLFMDYLKRKEMPSGSVADAICLIQSFYAMAVQLAQHLDIDVDRPRHLSKVTSTI